MWTCLLPNDKVRQKKKRKYCQFTDVKCQNLFWKFVLLALSMLFCKCDQIKNSDRYTLRETWLPYVGSEHYWPLLAVHYIMSRLNGYRMPLHQAAFHLLLQGRHTPITHERQARGNLQLKPGGWIYSLEPVDLAVLWAMSGEHLTAHLSSCNWKCTH